MLKRRSAGIEHPFRIFQILTEGDPMIMKVLQFIIVIGSLAVKILCLTRLAVYFRERGHKTSVFERDSRELQGLRGKTRAFMDGIYSRSVKKMLTRILTSECPDVVHVHNIYPIISPSVLIACREMGLPVVMRCPDYRLTCPTSWHFNQDGLCERCIDGREYWCILKNCRRNIPESVAYSLRIRCSPETSDFLRITSLSLSPIRVCEDSLG